MSGDRPVLGRGFAHELRHDGSIVDSMTKELIRPPRISESTLAAIRTEEQKKATAACIRILIDHLNALEKR